MMCGSMISARFDLIRAIDASGSIVEDILCVVVVVEVQRLETFGS